MSGDKTPPCSQFAIWIPCVPSKSTSQGAGKRIVIRNGKPMFFKNKEIREWVNYVAHVLAGHKPTMPMSGPLVFDIVFVFPVNKSDVSSRKKHAEVIAKGLIPHDTKPDWDNAPKAVVDVMVDLDFFADEQIVDGRCRLFRGLRTGVYLSVKSWEPDESTAALARITAGKTENT